MPLYEYQCDACAHRFEKIVQYSDPPIETCPKCGGRVQKQFSSPAIQFKGSGFYITDYAKKSSPEHSGGGKSSEKSSDKASDAAKGDTAKADASKSDSKSDSSKSDAAAPAPAASTSKD